MSLISPAFFCQCATAKRSLILAKYPLSELPLKTFQDRSLDQMSIPRTAAHTDKAPQPYGGLYSQAIIAGGVVYCSGIVAIDPETGSLVDGDVKAHTVIIIILIGR